MKTTWIKRTLLAAAMALGISAMSAPASAQTRFSVGIGVGAPGYYAPPTAAAYRPAYPGPGFTWADGYYNPGGVWVAGFWRPPVARGYAPGFYGGYRGGFDRDFRGSGFERHEFHGRR